MTSVARFTCQIDGCGQAFGKRRDKEIHRRTVHGKASRSLGPTHQMSPQDAYAFVDSLDLPDGAHWAMIEELSGAEPGDFA